jgi:Tol biopolymer transport system component
MCVAPAGAQITERVSLNSAGQQGNGPSSGAALSADGRFVAFRSYAGNLVPGDTNVAADVFVRDHLTGLTERVSVTSAGQEANSSSWLPSLSADGRFVAFVSRATNLVAGDINGFTDVFVHDRQTGLTTCVSRELLGAAANGESGAPILAADGSCVAFQSSASNLVAGDTNGELDVFLHDLASGQTFCISLTNAGAPATGRSGAPALSADGLTVAFESDAPDLVASDTNGEQDVFVYDRMSALTSRVSVNTPGGESNGSSGAPSLSGDGMLVAFHSSAGNLVLHDTNHQDDVFVHDRVTGKTGRVSVSVGNQQGNRGSHDPVLSADGIFVAFRSGASNLVTGDTNASEDVFLHHHPTGKIRRASVAASGAQAQGASVAPSLSADGRLIAFESEAANLVPADTNATSDVFLHDRLGTGPRLLRSGFCPGELTITVTRATPGGFVALAYGPAGTFVKPGAPCQGLTLGISNPMLRGPIRADAHGNLTVRTGPLNSACGLSMQVVDVSTCAASNVVLL